MSISITPENMIKEIEEEMTFLSNPDDFTIYTFHPTRKYTQTFFQVIEQLPIEFHYPKKLKTISLSNTGITIKGYDYYWNEIFITGIKTRRGIGDQGPRTKHWLLVVLNNKERIEVELSPRFFDYEISEFESALEIYKRTQIGV